ncbi:thiol reductase thioredoxin [Salipaludibacillus keqinensis]|uniref:Thiol reductase thioredoxin n=1 Tax=Salipaludibacillus keqinensis TaxID=2045207 RepID=A0A323TET4_9BACI|nr:thioredoxin family protein [Salipaludibacillus keqinensis]PYZ93792.1 thiol reductase thioredoxin [Salipaludibacillus keqinensis]
MEELKSMEHYQEVIQEEGSVLMFTAGWCPDCVVIEPVLPELQQNHRDLNFYKVNRDEFIELCQDLQIFGIPSFLVFKKGEEIHRFVSKDRKSKEEIDSFLTEAKQK